MNTMDTNTIECYVTSHSWSIQELIAVGKNFFQKSTFISSPHLEAEILLGKSLKKDRLWLYKNPECVVDKVKNKKLLTHYVSLLQRRSNAETIAYLIEEREFYEHIFYVNHGVLVPRPETEELLSLALKLPLVVEKGERASILDICCGSGCLGLSFLLKKPEVLLHMSDLSPLALKICRKNSKRLLSPNSPFLFFKKWIRKKYNYRIYQSDLFSKMPNYKYNLILCNPPYVLKDEYDKLSIDIRKSEPREALVCPTPSFFYSRLFKGIYQHLHTDGYAILETSPRLASFCKKVATKFYFEVQLLSDLSGKDRFILLKKYDPN